MAVFGDAKGDRERSGPCRTNKAMIRVDVTVRIGNAKEDRSDERG
jgi:hypothetical protein